MGAKETLFIPPDFFAGQPTGTLDEPDVKATTIAIPLSVLLGVFELPFR